MEEMVHVYFFGKQYEVPGSLTIMRAMEYGAISWSGVAGTASAAPAPPCTG